MSKKKKDVVEAEIISENTKIEKTDKAKSNNTDKPYLVPRIIAYIFDILIISLITTGILFFIPADKNYEKHMEEYKKIQAEYLEQKINAEQFVNHSSNVVYDIDYSNVLPMIIEVTIIILYFAVFQFYNKGQTLGKRIMKIKVESTKKQGITINQLAIRTLIIHGVIVKLLIIGSLLFVGRRYYYWISLSLQFLNILVVGITLFMILFKKSGQGLHDVLAKTSVVNKI